MSEDERRLLDIRDIKRQRLHELDRQAARFGDAYVPPHIEMERVQLRHELGMFDTAVKTPARPEVSDELGASGRFLVYHEQNRQVFAAVAQLGRQLDDFVRVSQEWRIVHRQLIIIIGISIVLLLIGMTIIATYIVVRGT